MMIRKPALTVLALLAMASAASASDCAAVGQRVAKSQGGQLAKASPTTQNGRAMCVVVVLVPGRDGERPRRVEVAVPAE